MAIHNEMNDSTAAFIQLESSSNLMNGKEIAEFFKLGRMPGIVDGGERKVVSINIYWG